MHEMKSSDDKNQQNTAIEGSICRKISSVMLPLCSEDEVARKSTEFRNKEVLKTSSPIRQDNQLREPYELRSLSKKPVLDTLPVAQHPKMPIQQDSQKKTCTSLTRDDVDWDEDLRPSDDDNPGGAKTETAVPMPLFFSGGTSIPQRSCDAALRAKKPAKLSRAPGKTGAKARTRKKSTGLPSQSPTRADENLGNYLDCVDVQLKQLPEESSESRENDSAQAHQAIDFCGKFTTRDHNITPATEKAGLESTDTSHTKQNRAVYGVEPGIRSKNPSDRGTKLLSTDGNGQEGRGKEVGKKLAAALEDAETQVKSTRQGCKPANQEGSNQNSSNNQGASKSAVIPSIISPSRSKTGTTEKATRFHTTASSTETQWEDKLLSHVRLSAEERSGSDRNIDDGKQQITTDQVNSSDSWVNSSSKSAQTGLESSAHPNLPLDKDQKPSEPFLANPRPSPRKLFVDKNGSPLVIHLRKIDRAPLRAGSSENEEGKRTFFSYRPKGSESGYEGGSENDTLDEGSTSPDLAIFPILSNRNFPSYGSERARGELSNKTDGPSTQRSARANANASLKRSVGEANENITKYEIHEEAQKIISASTQHLAFKLEDERKSIDKILETYVQQCHLVLDQLFQAQEERIELCEQQMASIQTHHANIREELIDRLKDDGKQMMTRKRARSETLLTVQDPGPLGQPEKGRKRRHGNGTTITIDHD